MAIILFLQWGINVCVLIVWTIILILDVISTFRSMNPLTVVRCELHVLHIVLGNAGSITGCAHMHGLLKISKPETVSQKSKHTLRACRCFIDTSMASAHLSSNPWSPPRRSFTKSTRLAETTVKNFPHSLLVPKPKRGFHEQSFFLRSARLWNSVPSACFPPDYNLDVFKSNINKFLMNRPLK